MVHTRNCVAALAAALTFLLCAQGPPPSADGKAADAAAPVRAPTIGVVDLDKAIDNYPRALAERKKLQELGESFQSQLDEMTKRIDTLRAEVQLVKEGSRERDHKELELGLALDQRKGLAGVFRNEMDRARDRFHLLIYPDLEQAIAQVAKDRGVPLVLRMLSQPVGEEGVKDELAQQQRLDRYKLRTVWYAAEEIDLTPALIKVLQAWPAKNAAKPEPQPARPGGNGGGGE